MQASKIDTACDESTYKFLRSLGKKYPRKIDFKKVGRKIGWGGEGFIYGYGRDRVLKINLSSYSGEDWKEFHREVDETLRMVRQKRNRNIARVYDWGSLPDERVFYIEMERLRPLGKNEAETFKRYQGYYQEKRWDEWEEIGVRSESGKKMKEFIKGVRRFPGWHSDLLHFNVMKDKAGIWKAVDLESFFLD